MPTLSGIENASALPVLVPSRLSTPTPDRFKAEQRRVAEQIVAATKLSDTTPVMTFSAAPQQRLSRHLTELIRRQHHRPVGIRRDDTPITRDTSRFVPHLFEPKASTP